MRAVSSFLMTGERVRVEGYQLSVAVASLLERAVALVALADKRIGELSAQCQMPSRGEVNAVCIYRQIIGIHQ